MENTLDQHHIHTPTHPTSTHTHTSTLTILSAKWSQWCLMVFLLPTPTVSRSSGLLLRSLLSGVEPVSGRGGSSYGSSYLHSSNNNSRSENYNYNNRQNHTIATTIMRNTNKIYSNTWRHYPLRTWRGHIWLRPPLTVYVILTTSVQQHLLTNAWRHYPLRTYVTWTHLLRPPLTVHVSANWPVLLLNRQYLYVCTVYTHNSVLYYVCDSPM